MPRQVELCSSTRGYVREAGVEEDRQPVAELGRRSIILKCVGPVSFCHSHCSRLLTESTWEFHLRNAAAAASLAAECAMLSPAPPGAKRPSQEQHPIYVCVCVCVCVGWLVGWYVFHSFSGTASEDELQSPGRGLVFHRRQLLFP